MQGKWFIPLPCFYRSFDVRPLSSPLWVGGAGAKRGCIVPTAAEPIDLCLFYTYQIELLELDKSGIAVAEYWTVLPPKVEFERKIQEILLEARERLERRKLLTSGNVIRQIDYFIEPKDDDEE